jgi:hypothetical protein
LFPVSRSFRFGQRFLQGQDVTVVDALVNGFVRILLDQENAQTANFTFVGGQRRVRILFQERVIGYAIVQEGQQDLVLFRVVAPNDTALVEDAIPLITKDVSDTVVSLKVIRLKVAVYSPKSSSNLVRSYT